MCKPIFNYEGNSIAVPGCIGFVDDLVISRQHVSELFRFIDRLEVTSVLGLNYRSALCSLWFVGATDVTVYILWKVCKCIVTGLRLLTVFGTLLFRFPFNDFLRTPAAGCPVLGSSSFGFGVFGSS